MKASPVVSVVTDFFRRTTLHGFKYLCSRYTFDRMVWMAVCCASACSAGVLCAVLWARFLQQPAIVAVKDLKEVSRAPNGMPLVVVCPPADFIADQVIMHFKKVGNKTGLTLALSRVIRKKMVQEEKLRLLDKNLDDLGITLPDALMKYSPECQDMIVSCRWQNNLLPCRMLFRKRFTDWGLCCVLDPIRLQNKTTTRLFDHLETTRRLDIALTCVESSVPFYGCELLILYDDDDVKGVVPQILHRGLSYWLQTTFTTTVGSDGSMLDVSRSCVPDVGYSRYSCIGQCLETECGCSDPLQNGISDVEGRLPRCRVAQLNCLRSIKAYERSTCSCLPSCSKFTTDIVIETTTLDFINSSVDPLYQGLDATMSSVVFLRVRLRQSKVFFLLPTETWLTLLSSLGGVFNMFLGVGLFSALEFFFFIIFKLPLALRSSSEMSVPDARYKY